MKTKIGIDGEPFDPATKAAKGLALLRAFVETAAEPYPSRIILTEALNSIADRLQTCDALEAKLEKLGAR